MFVLAHVNHEGAAAADLERKRSKDKNKNARHKHKHQAEVVTTIVNELRFPLKEKLSDLPC